MNFDCGKGSSMNYLENGTKQAAIIANQFLKKNQHLMSETEAHALRLLIAAADQNPDQQPETWHCDTYCRKVRHAVCEGELSVDSKAEKSCPYLDEMLY